MAGEELKKMREERGLTQQEVADLIGTTKQTIWNYENGFNISVSKQKLLAEVLGGIRVKKKEAPQGQSIEEISRFVVLNQEQFLQDPLFREFVEKLVFKYVYELGLRN